MYDFGQGLENTAPLKKSLGEHKKVVPLGSFSSRLTKKNKGMISTNCRQQMPIKFIYSEKGTKNSIYQSHCIWQTIQFEVGVGCMFVST